MFCPECGKKEMLVIEMNEVEADWCPECDGIWLDEGELEIVSNLAVKDSRIIEAIQKPAGDNGDRKCPRCRKLMIVCKIPTAPPIDIDICPESHGIWFDKDELRKILGQISQEPVAKTLSELLKK